MGETTMRRNFRNTGAVAEKMILLTAKEYERRGILTLRKVDPPLRTWGPGRTILLPNPWLDFAGAWTERDGRMFLVEVKSMRERQLRIGIGGVNDRQLENAVLWSRAGAAVLLLWECSGGWFAGPLPEIAVGTETLSPGSLMEVQRGTGLILVDFVKSLRTFWPEKQA